MDTESQIIQCLNTLDLLDSIQEAAEHLDAHPSNPQLRADTVQAISSVETFLPQDDTRQEAQRDLEAALSGTGDEQPLQPKAKRWRNLAFIACTSSILPLLEQGQAVCEQTATRLYQMAARPGWTEKSRAVLLYYISSCCAATLPEQAYNGFLTAFQLNPYVIRVRERDASPPLQTPQQRTISRCPTCGGIGTPYFAAKSFLMNTWAPMFEPAKLWMRCPDCGNLYTHHFPEAYLASGQIMKKIEPHPSIDRIFDGTLRAHDLYLWGEILKRLESISGGRRVLEVGIGNGFLIAAALELGFEVESVEIEEDRAQRIADILNADIWCADFLQFDTDRRYSIITMGDVIEHVTDPGAALRKAHELLENGGVLWLSTPNFESSFSRLKKFQDSMWNEPYHISYFNYRGLRALAERCGFEITDYTISQRYNGSMELILRKAK